jgi:hypothetical protein
VTNAALPTVEQLRGLFTRAGLAMDETSEASDPQTYYTLTARGVAVQIQAITEDGEVRVIQGAFPRFFGGSAQHANNMLGEFLYACHPDFTNDSLYQWICGTGYASWGAQLIGASPGGPWYGHVQMGDNWASVAYISNHGSDMLGVRFADKPSRATCNVHPEVWMDRLLAIMDKPAYVPVDSLQRYPDRYKGQVVTLTGTLAQKVDDAHYVVKTYDGRRVFCPMLFGMNPAPVLEGDSVRVTGISAGLIVSRTVLGAATELPCILAFAIK